MKKPFSSSLAARFCRFLVAALIATAASAAIESPLVAAEAPRDLPDVTYRAAARTPEGAPSPGTEDLKLDIFGAVPGESLPALLFIHGGGWTGGSRKDFAASAKFLSKQGYVCFSTSYRLVKPDMNKWPTQLDDVQLAVRWIRAHAKDYGVNPDRIGAIGASAGGHLAALLGTRDTQPGDKIPLSQYSSRVQCVVDFYGPTDFIDRSTLSEVNKDTMFLLFNLIGDSAERAPEKYRDASPIAFIDEKTAPFLIIHGAQDKVVPLSQSIKMDAALKAAQRETTLLVFPDEGHSVNNPVNFQKVLALTTQFLARHLKP